MEDSIEETDPNYMEFALKRSLISRNKLAIILKGTEGVTQFCCVECSARFTDKEKLELHLCLHSKQYRYICEICGTGLKRKEHLDRHTLEHQQVRPHHCQVCGKAFKRKEHLNIHMSVHSSDKTQVCALCNRSFHRKDHLQKHLLTHNKLFLEQNMYPVSDQDLMEIKQEIVDDDDDNQVPDVLSMDSDVHEGSDSFDYSESAGDSCGSASESAEIRTPDAHNERPHVCEICFKSYKRRDHLKIHSWTHMKKDKICTECGKGFHKTEQLAGHMRVCIQVHLKTREDLDDDIQLDEEGNEQVMMANSLLVERVIKSDPETRPYECVVCRRRFKRKQHLKAHANVHLKQLQGPTIWCSICHEGFFSNSQFEAHECLPADAQALEQTDEPTEVPPEAKKENSHPTQFLEQLLIEQAETSDHSASYLTLQEEHKLPVPMRVYVCKYCGKPFKRKDHYKIHLHIHTGVKSFFCPDCGKGFYRKDHLQKHSQVHAKPKPKPKKQLPGLVPLSMVANKRPMPEITIHAPSNSKLRVPLQIKVPYQMVVSNRDGEKRTLTIDPQASQQPIELN